MIISKKLPATVIKTGCLLVDGASHHPIELIANGIRGHVTNATLIKFPINIATDELKDAVKGLKNFPSSITIGKSTNKINIACFHNGGISFFATTKELNHPG